MQKEFPKHILFFDLFKHVIALINDVTISICYIILNIFLKVYDSKLLLIDDNFYTNRIFYQSLHKSSFSVGLFRKKNTKQIFIIILERSHIHFFSIMTMLYIWTLRHAKYINTCWHKAFMFLRSDEYEMLTILS